MKGIWEISLIASILFLGLGFSQDVFAFCGDGFVDAGEECDGDGAGNAGETTICDLDCTISICGDGYHNTVSFEECDDGPSNSDSSPDACRTNCELPACGDNVTDTGEQCDEGFGNDDFKPDTCRVACLSPTCGDGVRDTLAGEACDDGNTTDEDGCSSSCQYETVVCPACAPGTTFNETTNACEPDVTQADLDSCNSDLATCQGDLSDTQGELTTAQNDLSAALAQIAEFGEILLSGEVELCHKGNTQTVSLASFGKHVAHGDTLGACE